MLKKQNLAFFFTDTISLKKWHEGGMLEREIAIYNKLAKHFSKIYLFTYGDKSEFEFQKHLHENIKIIPKNRAIPDFLYQFILPIKHRKILKKCYFLKTNQIYGSIPAIIWKIFNLKSCLIIRSGYVASLNAKLYGSGFFWKTYVSILEFIAYKICDQAIITTAENKMHLVEKYPFLKNKITVVENWIDSVIFAPQKRDIKYDIGYVGRLQKDKNLLNLLKAVRKMQLKVCFVGQGEESANLENFARQNRINFTNIKRIANYELHYFLNQLKVFVFPSLHEGSPKALLEAMSCGLPVIGCDVVGVNNIIKDGKNGLLATPDCASLSEKIKLLLDDNILRKKIGQRAREYILTHHDLTKIFQKELKIYEKISQKNNL